MEDDGIAVSRRLLTSHQVGGLNMELCIEALGDSYSHYLISALELGTFDAASDAAKAERLRHASCSIRFQCGGIQDSGVNGISNEALLAIVEDRLSGFQRGPFACRENSIALTKLQEAMMWLHRRTRERVARGVEGTPVI